MRGPFLARLGSSVALAVEVTAVAGCGDKAFMAPPPDCEVIEGAICADSVADFERRVTNYCRDHPGEVASQFVFITKGGKTAEVRCD